jgi:hypothetical protein
MGMSVAFPTRSSTDYHPVPGLEIQKEIGVQVTQYFSGARPSDDGMAELFLHLADNPSQQDIDQSLYDVFASAALSPNFRNAVLNLTTSDLPNHKIKLSDYPIQSSADIQQGIFSILVPVLTQVLGGVISSVTGQSGIQAGIQADNTVVLPDHVQQGIFDILTKFLNNPIFKNVVSVIAQGVIDKNKTT